jgi:protocatechuate 3,4-dioxygenase beta subunit
VQTHAGALDIVFLTFSGEPMHAHDHGLAHDLETLLKRTTDRRQMLKWLALGGAASLPLIGCGGGTSDASASASTSTGSTSGTSSGTTSGTSSASCSVIPEETSGPYPGDGSNSNASGIANVLAQSGIVRSDIRSSFGASGSDVAQGVPLTITLSLVNTNASCGTLAGYAIYLWHCTRDGLYSMYSAGVTGENFLRGVQEPDSNGHVTFTTIFPGCYSGRMPHVHFEVYPSLAKATAAGNKVKTSQFTFPMATLNEAYTATGYSASVSNLAQISYATDNVFSDGTSLQMATISGNATTGYTATLQVAIAA